MGDVSQLAIIGFFVPTDQFTKYMVIFIGRIRTKEIKKLAFAMIEKNETFTPDFEANKRVLDELKLTDQKKARNRIAGYIARIMKRKPKQ
ncbi:MAG: 30S ribosomal protein S17e [Candidatus Aenigmatarchaeota archaeon]